MLSAPSTSTPQTSTKGPASMQAGAMFSKGMSLLGSKGGTERRIEGSGGGLRGACFVFDSASDWNHSYMRHIPQVFRPGI